MKAEDTLSAGTGAFKLYESHMNCLLLTPHSSACASHHIGMHLTSTATILTSQKFPYIFTYTLSYTSYILKNISSEVFVVVFANMDFSSLIYTFLKYLIQAVSLDYRLLSWLNLLC